MFETIPILNWFTVNFYMSMITFIFVLIIVNLIKSKWRTNMLLNQKYLTSEKVILITGGCMGIGKELIQILINKFNCKVINVDIREDLFESLNEVLINKNKIENYKCDLSNFNEMDKVFKEIFSRNPKINIFINNAAIAVNDYIYNLKESHIIKSFEVNLISPSLLTKKFLSQTENFKDDEFHVVTTASIVSHLTFRKSAPYVASKWGLYGLHECIRLEYHDRKNINFSIVFPFCVNTGMFPGFRDTLPFINTLKPEAVAQKIIEGIILKEGEIYLPNILRCIVLICKAAPTKVVDFIYFFIMDKSTHELGSREFRQQS